jgi:hypothetical protein
MLWLNSKKLFNELKQMTSICYSSMILKFSKMKQNLFLLKEKNHKD